MVLTRWMKFSLFINDPAFENWTGCSRLVNFSRLNIVKLDRFLMKDSETWVLCCKIVQKYCKLGETAFFSPHLITWYNNHRVTSYFTYKLHLLHEFQVNLCIRVTSYFYSTSFELWFMVRVKSYCLLQELRVTYCIWVVSSIYCRVAS